MKKFILLLSFAACILCSSPVPSFGGGKDPVLSCFASDLKKGVSVSYYFSAYDKDSVNIFSGKGTAYIKDASFRIDVPSSLLAVSDGNSEWIYNRENNEITILSIERGSVKDISSNPFYIFYADGKDYEIEHGKTPDGYFTIKLIPRGRNNTYESIAIDYLKKGTSYFPGRITMYNKNGANYVVQIRTFSPLPSGYNMFTLDPLKYVNAVVTDLRQ
ncbi:MAG: outer membrane lipoprotein carrier protein LolA [Bacteroidales bacterium]|jgi:outer membrane lipoprotein-sorting protein|nr:outer membrane lipoprotein carrier protein LolA [Bacteroidales bacterium]